MLCKKFKPQELHYELLSTINKSYKMNKINVQPFQTDTTYLIAKRKTLNHFILELTLIN